MLLRDEVAGVHAPAVTFSGNTRGSLVACYIHNNAAGIVVDGAAAPSIENNLVKDNGEPGLFLKSSAHASVIANIFADNGARAVWMFTAEEELAGANYFIRFGRLIEHPKFRVLSAENSDEEDQP